MVYFGPEYLGLVKEGPKQRRRNTDILISQARPRYFSALSDLKKIVESKNALLKMERPNTAMLEIINEKLASISSELIAYRSAYLEKTGALAGGDPKGDLRRPRGAGGAVSLLCGRGDRAGARRD